MGQRQLGWADEINPGRLTRHPVVLPQVTFYDIKVEYDNAPVSPKWTTAYVDDACNNRVHILNETTIQITWDTAAVEADAAEFKTYMS